MARFEHLTPGESSGTGAGYTAFVRLLKILLPLSALALAALVVVRLQDNPLHDIETAITQDEKTAPGQIEVKGARYEGVDENGRPYTLIAERAVRIEGASEAVRLEGLKADAALKDGGWISASAGAGIYAVDSQKLDLSSGVTLYHDSGTEARLDALSIDLKARAASSETPVRLTGPLGEIDARGLKTLDNGDRVIFAGPVKMKIFRLGGKG